MKKSFKKVVSAVLIAVLILSLSPVGALSEVDFSALFSVETKALTSGDFNYEVSGANATITGYFGSATNLVVNSTINGKTVVAIEKGAFKGNTTLKSVTLPSTVTRIGVNYNSDGAFAGCTKLETVTFAKGTSNAIIGFNTFSGCAALKSATIPGNYVEIQNGAFENCQSMTSLTWEKSSDSNQKMGSYAFKNCSALSNISLPTTLGNIGEYAFEGCSPANLELPEGITFIGKGAFKNNVKLKKVLLPSTLTKIGESYNTDGAFTGCTRLETVVFTKGTSDAIIGFNTFSGCAALKAVELPGNYVAVQNGAFENCKSITSLTWKKSDGIKQSIGSYTFKGCTALESVSLPTSLSSIGEYSFQNCAIKELVVPEGVTFVAKGAFLSNVNLKSVSLPSTLTKIGESYNTDGAFSGCTKLETVMFAAGTADAVIGFNTFSGCAALKSAAIPGNYVEIQNGAFENCKSMTSLTINKADYSYAVQSIGNYTFKNCSSLAEVTLPITLKSIGEYAFQGCAIANLVVPEGVIFIGKGAFLNNTSLRSVSLPGTLTKIGESYNTDGAFAGCTKLETVTFAKGSDDATIGFNTFRDCAALKAVSIPGNYVAIQNGAFENCKSMTTFIFEKSDYAFANQSIGNYTFKNCTELAEITLPTTLKSIGEYTFENCATANLVVPEGVTNIGKGAFRNNTKLLRVDLPGSLTKIGETYNTDGTFAGCSMLETVVFAEGENDLTIGNNTFANCPALATVHLPLNLVTVGAGAFNKSTENLTLCSKLNTSFGKKYAEDNSIKFRLCDGTHKVVPGPGDVSGDGKVNSNDALMVLQFATGLITLTDEQMERANVNGDANINSGDALMILQFATGLITKF